jgi:Myb-like DNA-binding domain
LWTSDEDEAIKVAISKYRMGNYIPFSTVASKIPGRNAKQIAQRWRCQLDPTISRGNFSKKEDILLIVCRLLKKLSFRQISERYMARSENQLRSRYFVLKQSKKLEEKYD